MNSPIIESQKPIIGISSGDINGIGIELIIKTIADHRILELCTPVIFASNKAINFYRKTVPEANFAYQSIKEFARVNAKQVNIFNCWEEEIPILPGQLTKEGGSYAIKSLLSAVQALKHKNIHGLVTAPIHKKNIQSADFSYSGHTPFLKQYFEMNEVLMLMVSDNMKVGVLSEHIPVKDVASQVTRENLLSKLSVLKESLVKDFGVEKPKIAVLGLNPHAGDEGLIGKEEEEVIKPALKEFRQNNNAIVFGPYSADAFFARGLHENFDAVLAMYHDQGLIPFKSLAKGTGVNYTAGLPVVRTSPDHGTAFDIAGKNRADATSFINSIFQCIDIARQRKFYQDNHRNPLRKITAEIMANAEDENIEEER